MQQTDYAKIYERQGDVVGTNTYNFLKRLSVSIIGCGSIGSLLADTIYRMADFKEMRLIDFDNVDESNLVTQSFYSDELGLPKVTAIERRLRSIHNRTPIMSIYDRWALNSCGLSDVTFLAVDTITARKSFFLSATEDNRNLVGENYMCDIRAAGLVGQVLCITLQNKVEQAYYETTLFSEEEAATGRCTASSFNGMSKLLVGFASVQFLHWVRYGNGYAPHTHIINGFTTEQKIPNELIQQIQNPLIVEEEELVVPTS